MRIRNRIERLEGRFIGEPTILFMPDGSRKTLVGPKDQMMTLLYAATGQEPATRDQLKRLELIRKCVGSKEPGGARLVEMIQCFQHGPAKDPVAASE